MDNPNSKNYRGPIVSVQNDQKINALTTERHNQARLLSMPRGKQSKSIFKFFLIAILVLILGLGALVIFRASNLSNKIFVGQKTTFFQKIKQVISAGQRNVELLGENEGQINILLLGMGGEGHDGPYLTDTIILAQIRPEIGEIVLTSIPRDYLVELPNNLGKRKLNAAFAEGLGKNKDWDKAGTWARQQVEKISGLEIPYFAVVDFKGFAKAIDQVGGIDINIERTFTDYQFPDDFQKDTKGYLGPLTFKKGTERMGGERALQFARSRHAAGPEGSDFARSQRQQKVLNALKQRILDLNLVTDAGKANGLLSTFADHFHTNLSPGELYHLYSLTRDKKIHNFLSLSLDPETKLICPLILEDTGAYVLTPCPGKTAKDIQNYFKNAFSYGKLQAEKPTIWLANSTKNSSAYREIDRKLKNMGLTVWELPYPETAGQLSKTIVYQANPKPASVEYIQNEIGATEATLPPPGIKVDKNRVDIIIIIGQNVTTSIDPN